MNSQTDSPGTSPDVDELVCRVAFAIAAERGCQPAGLTPPLGDVVDFDALRRLLRSGGNDLRIAFTYQGEEVEIESDGNVTVRPVGA